MLHTIALASAIRQHESAIGTHMSSALELPSHLLPTLLGGNRPGLSS